MTSENRSRHPHVHPKGPDRVVRALAKRYRGKADMDLGNPKDTLLGVLLSARTTDVQVLKIFPAFKKRFPTWASLARSSPAAIGKAISSIGLYRSKAKAIHGLANMILKNHAGRVPKTLEELTVLPGVGRKTANCVLSHVYHQDTVCVDTHVFRIAHRLGWSRGKTPEKVEEDIKRILPKSLWSETNRVFVQFGRDICKARKPECWHCPVRLWCPYEPKTEKPKGKGEEGVGSGE
ncbi:endonuclease III [Patescibacteria group bacterium]|uniref:Endonuclease III n=1 Tax=candidate division WWE3 bacterium TaxID=2053526 RepID=A0A928TU90_UNCKA|nr:endonuclease III [candidate division WWE3 bacterium]MCL4732413.1 endonuclease III [Patescibacteria group bacterium]MDL1952838.1 endonuclease III [Candidatus Uhrbacteria bacterium UHB]RIL01074.1 MAG: endonuclease III [Candidatus Uhrbacteria bacterium]